MNSHRPPSVEVEDEKEPDPPRNFTAKQLSYFDGCSCCEYNDVRRTVWSDHPDEDKREVLAMNSNLEIVSVTRYRKFRDVILEL